MKSSFKMFLLGGGLGIAAVLLYVYVIERFASDRVMLAEVLVDGNGECTAVRLILNPILARPELVQVHLDSMRDHRPAGAVIIRDSDVRYLIINGVSEKTSGANWYYLGKPKLDNTEIRLPLPK